MLTLDLKVLDVFGLANLTLEDKHALMRAFYADLQLAVGSELAEGLSEKDLADFEEIIGWMEGRGALAPEDDPALAWLKKVAPNYSEVVRRHVERTLAILLSRAPQICDIAGVALAPAREDPLRTALSIMNRKREIREREAADDHDI